MSLIGIEIYNYLNKSNLNLCSQASDKDEKLYPHACEYTRGDSYASS